jgi:S-layer homology domain
LRRFTGYGDRICQFPPLCPPDVPPAASDVAIVTYTGSAGYVYRESAVLNPLHTVNNNTAYDFGAQYTVMVTPDVVGSMLQFKGVDIWWKRQISPPPGTASFTDVPTNAQFFAEIEAMKESGITAGCTASEFCPDLAVTRRQMAAFFARALGLYWQY